MLAEIAEIAGNLRTIISYCVEIVSGSCIIMISYACFVTPSFTYSSGKILRILAYATGTFYQFILFIFLSYIAGITISILFSNIPLGKKRRFFDTRVYPTIELDEYYSVLEVLQKEKYKLFRNELDGISYRLKIIRQIGRMSIASSFIFLISLFFSFNLLNLIFFLLSILVIIVCEKDHRYGLKYYHNTFLFLKDKYSTENTEGEN